MASKNRRSSQSSTGALLHRGVENSRLPDVARRAHTRRAHTPEVATMTEANVQLIQTVYEAFGRGDVPFIASRVRPEARWDFNVTRSDVPWHVPVSGPAEVPKFLAAFVGNVELEAFEPR